jgi:hydroxymethylbilane synthase
MLKQPLIIGTRGSELALWQAHHIQEALSRQGVTSEIKIIKTKGDRIQDLSFDKIEGKGFFTKELQEALMAGSIDLAVHSHKDLETTEPDGLCIAAVTEREAVQEVVIIRNTSYVRDALLHLPENAIVGTSSIRRKMILGHLRPDLQFVDLRGNVPTRIQKLRDQPWDAIVLAKAGLNRICPNLENLVPITLDPIACIPAPAQGALAIECRNNDDAVISALQGLHHTPTAKAVAIERGILKGIGGGCQVPLAAYAYHADEQWHVHTAFTNHLAQAMQTAYHCGIDRTHLIQRSLESLKIER